MFTLQLMNNKSGGGVTSAHGNVKRRQRNFFHGCQNLGKLINFLLLMNFFLIASHSSRKFIFVFSCFLHSRLRVCVFLMWKTIVNVGCKEVGKFDLEFQQEGRKNENHWPPTTVPYMTRQHEIESKCRRYSVIYRCGAFDWKKLSLGEENCDDVLTATSYLIYLHILKKFFHFCQFFCLQLIMCMILVKIIRKSNVERL